MNDDRCSFPGCEFPEPQAFIHDPPFAVIQPNGTYLQIAKPCRHLGPHHRFVSSRP